MTTFPRPTGNFLRSYQLQSLPEISQENKNDICDSEEETEETTKDPVSLHDNFTYSESVEKHEFIWNLYLAISNLQPKLERGKKFSK